MQAKGQDPWFMEHGPKRGKISEFRAVHVVEQSKFVARSMRRGVIVAADSDEAASNFQ
jgi:hypothetical protein